MYSSVKRAATKYIKKAEEAEKPGTLGGGGEQEKKRKTGRWRRVQVIGKEDWQGNRCCEVKRQGFFFV